VQQPMFIGILRTSVHVYIYISITAFW